MKPRPREEVPTRHVGIVGYDDVNALDIAGPAEALTSADDVAGARTRRYRVHLLAGGKKPFTTESGLVFQPHASLEDAPALDTLIIPGGRGLRVPGAADPIADWVRQRASTTRRIVSVCTGIYGLAPTGLLDGLRVATHWRHAADVAARFPRLRVDDTAVFVREGRFSTSAGVTAGVDLALALVEEDLGPRVALAAARDLVVYMRRPGGQEQYSEPLRFQTIAGDELADLVAYVHAHLREPLSVETMAGRVAMSPRQFRRRFAERFRRTPSAWLEALRLDEARRRLELPDARIDVVAHSVGFHTSDGLRRAFRRRFGVGPQTYRARFGLDS